MERIKHQLDEGSKVVLWRTIAVALIAEVVARRRALLHDEMDMGVPRPTLQGFPTIRQGLCE